MFYGVPIATSQLLVSAIRFAARKPRPLAARDRVYASEISACDRRITFGLLGCQPDNEQNDSPAALIGDAIHTHIEMLLEAAFPGRVETEVKVFNDAISGRIDALLLDDTDRFTVIDIKTVGVKEWEARSKMEMYVNQLSVYAALVDAYRGVVLLVNRDTGEMDEIAFPIDYQRTAALLEKARRLQALARNGQIAKAVVWGTEECKYCPFRNRCEPLDKSAALVYNESKPEAPAQ